MAEPTKKAAAYLAKVYEGLDKELQNEIQAAAAVGFSDVVRDLKARQARVQVLLLKAEQAAAPVLTALIGSAYQAGADFSIKNLRKIFSANEINAILSSTDRAAVQVLAENATANFRKITQIVGRRVDDTLRQLALQETTQAVATGESTATIASRLEVALQRANITYQDGIAHFVQVGDRNYRLDKYTEMVSRTTTREAATEGMKNRLLQNEVDLVQIDDAAEGACDICQSYQDTVYSISGNTEGYPQAVDLPPFHPNCRCVLTPAPVV